MTLATRIRAYLDRAEEADSRALDLLEEAVTALSVERRHVEQYWQRKAESSRLPRVRNEDLHAGSPMHYYCRHCGAHTETLPETHVQSPRTLCDGCAFLVLNALMPPPALP